MGSVWRRGRRSFTVAAVFMILTAAVHTAGNLAAKSSSAEETQVRSEMAALRFPLGMGMQPSLWDIYWDLTLTMSITLAALGLINLLLAASGEIPDRILRRVSWVNLIWVVAFLWLSWVQQVPPPLISGIAFVVFVAGSIWELGRQSEESLTRAQGR